MRKFIGLPRRPLGPWEAARWLVLDYFERLGPTGQGFLTPLQERRIRTGLTAMDRRCYNTIVDVCESLTGDLVSALYHISGLRVLTLELERILDQFCLAASLTEELGADLDKMGRRGCRIKAAIGYSLYCQAPLAIASGFGTCRNASLDPANAVVGVELFELARHADVTFLVRHSRQINALRTKLWQKILVYRELFGFAESVLEIDSWSKILEDSMSDLLCAMGRFEAKAIYLDCRLRRVVRNNTDPLRNPTARLLNEVTEKALAKKDSVILRSFYLEADFGLDKLDEDVAISRFLDAAGALKDPDQLLELLARIIEEKREEMIDAMEEAVARGLSTDLAGDPVPDLVPKIAKLVTAMLAEWPINYGYYATIDLTEIANWPEGGSIREKVRHWLAARAHTLCNLLSRDDPSFVARVLSKRDELRASVSTEVPGPTTYDSFLMECVLTDTKPMTGSVPGGEAQEQRRRSLEGLRRYKP
jgi:hypothetical protein